MIKNANFSVKTTHDLITYISLNNQFTDVLNDKICFSVRFCDNSLLELKIRFQVFSFAGKKIQRFSSELEQLEIVNAFKREIKKWKPVNCPCRLCRPYIQNVGFL